jgi:hypothetical protein
VEGNAVSGGGDGREEDMESEGLPTGRWKHRYQSGQYSSQRQQGRIFLSIPISERISDLPLVVFPPRRSVMFSRASS